MTQKHPTHKPLLQKILLLFFLMLLIVSVPIFLSRSQTHIITQIRAGVDDYPGQTDPFTPNPGDTPDPGVPADWPDNSWDLGTDEGNGTANGCKAAEGAGCTIGGIPGTMQFGNDGNWHWTPDYGGGGGSVWIGGGGGGETTPAGNAVLLAGAISSDVTHLQTCDQLSQIKTCLDSPGTAGCDAIPDKAYLAGTQFYLDGLWGPAIQSASTSGVSFTPVWGDYNHTVTAMHPSGNYSPYIFCHNTSAAPTWLQGASVFVPQNATANVVVGFGPILPWFKVTGGGNTYGNTIYSAMPLMVTTTLLFDGTTDASYYPGTVSSTTGVDFSDSPATSGLGNISKTNWNTDNALTPRDWYAFFSSRLTQASKTPYTLAGSKPAMEAGKNFSVYTAGDLMVTSPWVISDTDRIIMEVNGNLTINDTVNITGNGFIAFVVKGDISVNSGIGTSWDSTAPTIEGLYIANGTLRTGTTTTAGKERFVGKGIFIASTITPQRNLISVGHNKDAAADLFTYNPNLFMSMPDVLKDLSFVWQEVAP